MKTGPVPRPLEERFWAAVVKTSGGCWLFNGVKQKRYAVISKGPGLGMISVHRLSYEMHKGNIPVGMYICHKCDVKSCVNPEHLYVGTHEDNNRDNRERGRFFISKGRPLSVRGKYKKNRCLSAENRQRMIEEYKSGAFTQMELARRYRMSQGAVSATIRGWPGRKPDGGKRRTGFFRCKLRSEAYDEIRTKYAEGNVSQTELAQQYGITQTHVSRIVTKTTRRDVAAQFGEIE